VRASSSASFVFCSPLSLAVSHLFQSRWITISVHWDLRSGRVEFAEIIRCEFDSDRSDVLFKALQPGGAGYGNDPGFLSQEPGQRDLSRSRIPLCSKCRNQIYQSLIGLPGFRREARETAAIVLRFKLRALRNRSGQKSLAKRTEWNQADARLFQGGNNFSFRTFPPERVFTLKCCDGLDGVRSADGLRTRFR